MALLSYLNSKRDRIADNARVGPLEVNATLLRRKIIAGNVIEEAKLAGSRGVAQHQNRCHRAHTN